METERYFAQGRKFVCACERDGKREREREKEREKK